VPSHGASRAERVFCANHRIIVPERVRARSGVALVAPTSRANCASAGDASSNCATARFDAIAGRLLRAATVRAEACNATNCRRRRLARTPRAESTVHRPRDWRSSSQSARHEQRDSSRAASARAVRRDALAWRNARGARSSLPSFSAVRSRAASRAPSRDARAIERWHVGCSMRFYELAGNILGGRRFQ